MLEHEEPELPSCRSLSNEALLEQQTMIFSSTSNSSRRRDHLLQTHDADDGDDHTRSILETAPLEFIKAHMLLQETSSFGENKQQFKAPGSVPFKWEQEPGKPKSPSPINNISTCLQPPPSCLSRDSSRRDSLHKQLTSPSLSDKLRSILQLKLSSPVRSPTVSSLTKNSAEPRSSPVSILDVRKVFGTSPESCSSSPTRLSSSSRNTEQQVESPLSSAQFKKQLSLEIWERSLRESSSSSTTGCGFLKHMIVGCWYKPSSSKYGSSTTFENEELPRVSVYGPGTLGGEFESFKERFEDDECEDEGCFCEDQELENVLHQQEPDEVHTVDEGELAVFPVSAAFVFSKPALKKKTKGLPHATSASTSTSNKRVRFLIEDYSSDEDRSDDETKRKKEELFEDAISTEDEGFQRPARSVIRRRRKKKDASTNNNSNRLSKQSPGADSSFHANNFNLDEELSPDLQPMQDLLESLS